MGREEIELAQEIPLISTVTPLATVTIDLSDDLEQQQSKDILKRDPFFKPYTFGKFQIIHELQSERVKAVAFHPSPSHSHLLLVSFFTGIIALWDLNDHCIIDTFTGHMDAVRAIAFHPFLLLFASGGNDFHVGVWKYRLSSTPEERDRLDYMFLKGHNDFVRSVQFHPTGTLPWVISGSDDMTIRIWNHQSQMCLSVIFGHLHYVMSVCFHITYQQDELLVSGSLDQTVRVWDFKDLRQRAVGPMDESEGPPKYLHSPILDEPNLRGCFNRWKADRGVVVKYCLEGHSRGVNTVAVHPKYPEVIGSGGDDHKIRIWRMNRNNTAHEATIMEGHSNNVSAITFHPNDEHTLYSCSEDKTIQVWTIGQREARDIYLADKERFWCIAADKHSDLVAAGHDEGLIVFRMLA